MKAVSLRALLFGLVCLLTWGFAFAKDAKEMLQSIFPNQSITELQKLTSGLSGVEIYSFDLNQKPYILRHTPNIAPDKNISLYKVIQSAAKLNTTPPIKYSDPHKGILVQERISNETPAFLGLSKDFQMTEILKLLRQMQGIQTHGPKVDNIRYITSLESQLRNKWGCLPSNIEKAISEVGEVPASPDQLTFTHNDFHFNNLLWDGRRLWVIDFDDAGPGDSMFDFAWIIDYLQPTEKQRNEWLAQFLQRDITREDKARLRMHRKIHLVRDALFLAQSATRPQECRLPKSLEGAFDLLSRKNFKGQLDLSDNNTKLSAVNRLIEEALKL